MLCMLPDPRMLSQRRQAKISLWKQSWTRLRLRTVYWALIDVSKAQAVPFDKTKELWQILQRTAWIAYSDRQRQSLREYLSSKQTLISNRCWVVQWWRSSKEWRLGCSKDKSGRDRPQFAWRSQSRPVVHRLLSSDLWKFLFGLFKTEVVTTHHSILSEYREQKSIWAPFCLVSKSCLCAIPYFYESLSFRLYLFAIYHAGPRLSIWESPSFSLSISRDIVTV